MEAILEIYHRPEDRANPVVCVDETSKQHIKETRQSLPMAFGMPRRYDYEYARNGVSNLFMILRPFKGFGMLKSLTDVPVLILLISVEIWWISIFQTLKRLRSFVTISIRISRLRCIKRLIPTKVDVLLRSWRSTIPQSMGVG